MTGGAGYIGSNTCVELLAADHELCIEIHGLGKKQSNRICFERYSAN